MAGYDAQGRRIPGPNFQGGQAEFEAEAVDGDETLDLGT